MVAPTSIVSGYRCKECADNLERAPTAVAGRERKTYASVVDMVSDTSDGEFADKLERTVNARIKAEHLLAFQMMVRVVGPDYVLTSNEKLIADVEAVAAHSSAAMGEVAASNNWEAWFD
jgi:hypothetical protein